MVWRILVENYFQTALRCNACLSHFPNACIFGNTLRCKSTGCPKHAMYGRPGEMPQYCSAHKAEDMVDVKKRRRCNADGCERRASYALEGEKAAFCSAHKQPGHVNVNNRRCVTWWRCKRYGVCVSRRFTCLYCEAKLDLLE